MSYPDIFISKAAYKLLKQFKRSPMKTDGCSIPESQLRELRFIKQDLKPIDKSRMALPAGTFSITPEGIGYIEWHRKQTFHYWVPVILSLAAIVISIIAIIVSANTRIIVLQ